MDTQDYEKSDVSVRKAFVWAGIIVVGIAVFIIILNSFFISEMQQEAYESVPKPESAELRDLRAREIETLTSYKIIDEKNGVVQIHIERAMKLIADEAFENDLKKQR